jgi:ABC-type transport system involved in cytochrome bd biosynthesis fused ATPase/permease subunit
MNRYHETGGLIASLIAVAVGAVARYAITVTPSWISVHTAGLVLMILGIIGVVLSLAFAVADYSIRKSLASREQPPSELHVSGSLRGREAEEHPRRVA